MSLRTALLRGALVIGGLTVLPGSYGFATPLVPSGADADPFGACVRSPEIVRMRPTQNSPGARGSMVLRSPASPYGITVDARGHQSYVVTVVVEQLRRRQGSSYVVWAATPELDRVSRLGVLGSEQLVTGPVEWNKFLVFVSEETAPDVERWAGPIMLTALSPSGRMHTMAGHGPFEDVSCAGFY